MFCSQSIRQRQTHMIFLVVLMYLVTSTVSYTQGFIQMLARGSEMNVTKRFGMVYSRRFLNPYINTDDWQVGPLILNRVGKYDICRKQPNLGNRKAAFLEQTSRCSMEEQIRALVNSGFGLLIFVNYFPAPLPQLETSQLPRNQVPVCFISENTAFNFDAYLSEFYVVVYATGCAT